MDTRELERIILEEVKKMLGEPTAPAASNSYLDPGMTSGCSTQGCSTGGDPVPATQPQPAPQKPPKREGPAMLLLFSGVREPWQPLAEAIQDWNQQGIHLDAVLCDDARRAVKPSELERMNVRLIDCASDEIDHLRDEMSPYSAVLLPAISRTCAAKLALGISDNPLLHLAMAGLAHKLPVIAGDEGLSPDACIRFANAVPGIQDVLDNYRNQLSTMGVQLLSTKEALKTAYRVVMNKEDSKGPDLIVDLVTEEEAHKLQGPVVKAARGGLITPLAREILAKRGIEIVIVPQT